jgi:hypothetical protein
MQVFKAYPRKIVSIVPTSSAWCPVTNAGPAGPRQIGEYGDGVRGVPRDVPYNEIPVAFHDHRPYALCAFFGCWARIDLDDAGAESWLSLMVGAGTSTAIRLLALARDGRIPS